MSNHDVENDPAGRADEFLQVFKRGAEFTQDLLKEKLSLLKIFSRKTSG